MNTSRTPFFVVVLLLLVTDLWGQPPHVQAMHREKEAMKAAREYDREQRKAENEYYRELRKAEEEYYRELYKAEAEYYRELMQADREGYREFMQARGEAYREGRPWPLPPAGYGPPFPRRAYEEAYHRGRGKGRGRGRGPKHRRPLPPQQEEGVFIEGEVIIRGRKRIPIGRYNYPRQRN